MSTHQILVIVIFALTYTFIVLRPWRFTILSAAGSGFLLLLLFNLLTPSQAIKGLIGTEFTKPYTAIIFITAISFIFLMLDRLGFFEWCALKALTMSKGNGRLLFIYLYLTVCAVTVFTSNDIVILAMTPFIIYVAKYGNLNPVPFLIAEFFGANIGSMALPIGNPTNIIVFGSMGLDFLTYVKYMALPTLVAVLVNLGILYLIFKENIPDRFELKKIKPEKVIRFKHAIKFSLLTILLFLFLCSIGTSIGIEVWLMAIIFAFLFAIALNRLPDFDFIKNFKSILPEFPFRILVFVAILFLMTPAFSVSGLTQVVADSLAESINHNLFKGVFGLGFGSALTANLINNIPMTILFVNFLSEPSFLALPQNVINGSVYALIAGSNLGANITLIGALAGLIWIGILNQRGVKISGRHFLLYGLITTPLIMLVTYFIIWLEFLL